MSVVDMEWGVLIMNFEKSRWEKLNKILTFVAVVILVVWIWKWFSPEGKMVREDNWGTFFSMGGLFFIGVAAVCGGYLLWRFLDWLFWRKYFHDQPPPDEPM